MRPFGATDDKSCEIRRRLHDRRSIQAESIRLGDVDIEDLAGERRVSLEYHDLVRACPTHEPRGIRPARSFTQNLEIAADETFVGPMSRSIDHAQQVPVTLLFHAFADLLHRRRGSVLASGVTENESVIELNLFDEISGPAVIVVIFLRKP